MNHDPLSDFDASTVLAQSDKNQVITAVADGLYLYKGVETQRGPQCVELAERFYVTNYKSTFPYHNSGPGAYDIWEGIADKKDVGGWNDYRQHFVAYENGTTRPKPDDMLLYDRTRGSGWGHIAIIAEVYDNAVVILEQNSGWDTRKVLPLIENRIIDRGVKGVVRLKTNDQQNQ
jgi:hypothetical protein